MTSRYIQTVQVFPSGPVRVHGRPVGAVRDASPGSAGVCVLIETGDDTPPVVDQYEVWAVAPHQPVPEGGVFVAGVLTDSGRPVAVYAAPAR